MNKLLLIILVCTVSLSCTHNSEIEKYQNRRDNIVNVHEKVKEIEIEGVFIGSVARLYLLDDYLIVADPKSPDKLIRIFDKNSFNYIVSAGNRRTDEYYPTKFVVFDLNGNYLKTLDVGYKMQNFCIDDNNRIIMSMDDIIQFAYLDLDGLI